MRWREASGPLALAALLAAAAGLAWLTANPRSPLLDRAAGWEPVRPWVEAFRARFDPPPPEEGRRDGPGIEIVELPAAAPAEARARVWIEPGVVVREAPAPGAEAVAVVDVIANPRYSERRGDWYRLDRGGEAYDGGWAHRPDATQPAPTSGLDAARALPAARPDADAVATARHLMAAHATSRPCGPYSLVTDVGAGDLAESCARLAAALDGEYRAAFGVAPVGEADGAILLFAERAAYRSFADRHGGVHTGYAGYANAARGYVALTAEDVPREWLLKNLVHELTHLVTRRAVGPALPRWLAEGISDLLGDRARADGFALPASVEGSAGEAARLRAAYGEGMVGGLERLVALGEGEFDAAVRSFDYEQSAFFVRYLVESPVHRDAFVAFLREVAAGGSSEPDALAAALGADWASLDGELERWFLGRWLPSLPAR